MLIDHHKLVVDECLTMWAARGEAHLGDRQSPTECLEKWEDAFDILEQPAGGAVIPV